MFSFWSNLKKISCYKIALLQNCLHIAVTTFRGWLAAFWPCALLLIVYFLSPGSELSQSFIGLATCDSGLGKTLIITFFFYLNVIPSDFELQIKMLQSKSLWITDVLLVLKHSKSIRRHCQDQAQWWLHRVRSPLMTWLQGRWCGQRIVLWFTTSCYSATVCPTAVQCYQWQS